MIRSNVSPLTTSRQVGSALLLSLALAGGVAVAHAESALSSKESTVDGKTDPTPPPPPSGGAAPGVRVRTWSMDPAAPRVVRIAHSVAAGLSLAETTDLVEGAPPLMP